ncbi:hypothetical protein L486_04242 [Kwoniella mangroviensis CBS 10435]|uniref:Uncharacterized protein n=1 Tax=Kwoniella mangroviensis CBS 10435 TaxID=1331196 RepID=A0A1B9IRQ5_9TREE|nr:hypothetical protein L486_04242 [Kwoniella mangroviensis CBS 10435]
MRVATPTPNSLHPLTPPTTGKKALHHSITPSSPLSPNLNAIKANAKAEDADDWRELPLILYHDSRQLSNRDAATKTSPSQSIGQGGKEKEEALFFEKSVTPSSDETLKEIDESESDDEVVFVGDALSVTSSSRNNIHHSSRPKSNIDVTPESPAHHQDVVLSSQAILKRTYREVEDEEEVSFVGRSYKVPRLNPAGHAQMINREDTPLQAMVSSKEFSCLECGCSCGGNSSISKGKGSGSTTLSAKVRGNITSLLLNQDQSLYDQLRSDPRVQDWKDIAELVGAQREDYDRVRHAARWLQQHLPGLVAKGLP